MFLKTINDPSIFHTEIPSLPMGKYVHIVVLRETNSFPLFQTDQELNFARVSAGRNKYQRDIISRIVMFKRKQTTPERLTGRELLRRYDFISADETDQANYCEYNSERFCKHCSDCIYYGFAIGQEGSEKAKVLVDSAFSLSPYDESHQTMTFNAPYEHGTMSKNGETKSSFGEQDHILPQTFFPTIVTIKDPTETEFIYVLNNILRTKRYGAQTTRTGTVDNHILAIAFTDGEIFSGLKLTQSLYDTLEDDGEGHIKKGPYNASELQAKAIALLPELLKEDCVTTALLLTGAELTNLLQEIGNLVTNEETLLRVLQQSQDKCKRYSDKQRPARDSSQSGKKNSKSQK